MKKLAIWIFIIFVFIAAIYAVIQSEIGRNFTRNLISNALKESGFEVQIDQLEGTLPHQIDLKGVTIQGNGLHVTIAEVSVRPVLWRLLTQDLAFNDVHAKGISWHGIKPFDFDGKFRVDAKRFFVKGQIADWKVAARFNRGRKRGEVVASNRLVKVSGDVTLGVDNRFHVIVDQPFGRVVADGVVTNEGKGEVTWQMAEWDLKGRGEAVWQNGTLKGEVVAEGVANARVDLNISSDLLVGTSELNIENLQAFHIPNVFGKLNARAKWDVEEGIQTLQLDATAANFYYGTFFADKASFYSNLKDPFQKISGLVDCEVEKGKWHDLELENGSLETTLGEEGHPFRLFAEGRWKHPLEVHMNGTWQESGVADVQEFTGTFYNHPFALMDPVHFMKEKEGFSLSDTTIEIAGGSAFVRVEETGATIRLHQMPIDILSLNPLDVPVSGAIDLEAKIKNSEGDLTVSIRHMSVAEKIDASGQFTGHFDKDLLYLKGDLLVGGKPLFDIDVAVPIHFSLWPFKATLLTHNEAKGQIALHGRVEDFLDFFDLGPHRIEGECNGVIHFTNTLSRPLVDGKVLFQNSSYQNYYTGTQLSNIRADFLAEKNVIYLRSLTTADGTLSANGDIQLLESDHYPFQIDAKFRNLKFAQIDLVTASANGQIHIEGNTISAIAKGNVQIIETELTIPDHIPRPVPNLQVTYKNQIHPIALPQTEYRPYPLFLDLNVTTPELLSIQGRGLNSKWTGAFHLGGTYTSLATQGKLELVSGEFNFSGRSFKLTDGALSLSGTEHEMPHINLAGTMETKGITIIARLQGPLDNPQITLQSTPPLPLGSIMSYLLFGQDMSEIGGFQALQLATSLANLAGTGPDVMENTRRSLGVDRLRVITDTTEEGGETVSLQVGKYVSEGVLVSFSQGTEESNTNVSVEIELRGNFVFQVESDQHQEQGKFTLKWNLNY